MTIDHIAQDVAALNAANKGEEAGEKYWADAIVSIEAMDGPMARVEGKAAVKAKSDWWYANHTVHAVTCRAVYAGANTFAIVFWIDVTPKDSGVRVQMEELGIYTVADGKIVEERFIPSVQPRA